MKRRARKPATKSPCKAVHELQVTLPSETVREIVLEEVRKLVAEARRDKPGWRQMETAPHDGTRVLLLVTLSNSAPTVQIGTRASGEGAAWVIEGVGIWNAFRFHGWQPLPEAPENLSRESEFAAPERQLRAAA